MKKRIEYVDALKGFGIFCVLWGHSIQYLRTDSSFLENEIYAFIYSFHIPLFFFISGLFFTPSLKLDAKVFFSKKAVQLLWPCCVWAILFFSYRIFTAQLFDEGSSWKDQVKFLLIPFQWPFWFLRELFISYAITYVSIKTFRSIPLAFVISLAFVAISPYGNFQRFLLPIFWGGIFFKKNYESIFSHGKQYLILSGILFLIGLIFWKARYIIYVSDFPKIFDLPSLTFHFENLHISLFRLVVGLSGSVFFVFLFGRLYRKNVFFKLLEHIGIYTLAIYILQTVILEHLANRLIDFSGVNLYIYNWVITPLISVLIAAICIGLIKLISANKKIEFALFGRSYQKPI
jgi:fucose 4-O-acetylase-like acetyltransferase